MLTIVVPGEEYFDDEKQEFVTKGDVTLHLEHSLVSLSKWEEIYEKPFLSNEEKTPEEVLVYIECMILDPEIPPGVLSQIDDTIGSKINQYINSKKSATWFNELPPAPKSSEMITSELIYYWLVMFRIPFEVENWHLNRLFNLIKICNIKNSKPKKMSRSELAARNRELNAKRKAQLGTRG
jgi:hypothetical protein